MRGPRRLRPEEIDENYHGYPVTRFQVEGADALLIKPHSRALGRPWIWRTEFHDAWPAVDLELLRRGLYYLWVDLGGRYGSPEVIRFMDRVYDHVVGHFSVSHMVVLEGFSRGGLSAYRWAAHRPSKIACIYADAPVCDIKSWPGGKGKGAGSPEDWQKLLGCYGFADEQAALGFKENPIDVLAPLVKYDVPLIHVCGDADDVVPMAENTDILAARYRELGGRIEIITKPGVGHHPHSLEDPSPVVDFICKAVEQRVTPK